MLEYGTNTIGKNLMADNSVTIGFPPSKWKYTSKTKFVGITIGDNGLLRPWTMIYADVIIGDNFKSGHNVLIREGTRIGNNVSIGSYSIVEGDSTIGDDVNIQSLVYLPLRVTIGDGVFIGPNAVFTNDKYPPSKNLCSLIIKDHAAIGANSTLLPGITIGEGSLVAAGAVVTKDVPDYKMAIGCPAKIKKLPKAMRHEH
jgi:acetyltransferase-like isoleucine patch superfamily enzyme